MSDRTLRESEEPEMTSGPLSREEGVRAEDLDSHNGKTLRMELVDLHKRLGGFERHMSEVKDQIDARLREIEITLAKGVRMPGWLAPVLTTLGIFFLGQLAATVWWGAQLSQRVEALPGLERQCEECDAKIRDVREIQVDVLSRLKETERQLSGGTDDRWRKADDVRVMADLNRYLDERFAALDKRVTVQESRSAERDRWWQQVWSSGIFKGFKGQ